MDYLYNLSGRELFNKALDYKFVDDYDNYIIYMTMAANYNYIPAINNIYKDNTYKKQNYNNTRQFFIETANDINLLKNSFSVHFLAYMYNYGLGVEKNYGEAIKLYKIAIEKGCIYSYHNLGFMYKNGIGIDCDYNKAFELFTLALEFGCVESFSPLAEMYKKGLGTEINYIKAIGYYKIAIKNGNINSFYDLADIYKGGLVSEPNYDKAMKLYKLAIKKNHLDSYNALAEMYAKGIGIEINYENAISLYKTAIKKGHTESLSPLIHLWIEIYTSKRQGNYKCESYIYDLVIKNNDMHLINSLGFLYELFFSPRKYNRSIKLYNLAIEKDYGSSFNNLANMYENARGVKADTDKAIELYEQGIIYGCMTSYENLGNLYQKTGHLDKARKIYEDAVEKKYMKLLDKLVAIYKKISCADNKNEIIAFLNKINSIHKLSDIYGYDDYTISTIRDNYQFKLRIAELEKQLTHVDANPQDI